MLVGFILLEIEIDLFTTLSHLDRSEESSRKTLIGCFVVSWCKQEQNASSGSGERRQHAIFFLKKRVALPRNIEFGIYLI